MGKNKLERFAENSTFKNLIQLSYEEITNLGQCPFKGKWRSEFFGNDKPIVLELGCGKGEYTVGLARKYPEKNFIGIDIKGARLWRGCKTSNEENMKNVAFVRTHIQMITSYFDANEVDEIWITFPDPQLKKPNKRLTSERFLQLYSQILKPQGLIHLKTDSAELYDFTLNEVLIPSSRDVIYHTADLYHSDFNEEVIEIQTFYESMYLKEGKPITYIKFRL